MVYPLFAQVPEGGCRRKGKFPIGRGRIVTLISLGKWKEFSTRAGRQWFPCRAISWGILWIGRSTFGIPIAKQWVPDWNAAGSFTENMAQGIQTQAIPKNPGLCKTLICMGFGAHRRAHGWRFTTACWRNW
jgi:hypothetical protein